MYKMLLRTLIYIKLLQSNFRFMFCISMKFYFYLKMKIFLCIWLASECRNTPVIERSRNYTYIYCFITEPYM